MRDVAERLRDVLEAIERIERRSVRDKAALEADELLQVWMIHHRQTIGEACRAIPEEFRGRHPDVPWKRIIGMRHILVHHYFEIDVDLVWSVLEKELPDMAAAIRKILAEVTRGA